MRAIDWQMSIAVRDHWHGRGNPKLMLCPLLCDLDGLLSYLDRIALRPGFSVSPCPHCGQEHRWALIKELMCHALELRPAHSSKLLKEVDRRLESVRALYGGKAEYEAMCREAEAFFARVGTDNVYKP
jgi:hypothetical protein